MSFTEHLNGISPVRRRPLTTSPTAAEHALQTVVDELERGNVHLAQSALQFYARLRNSGTPEPPNGDKRAIALSNKLAAKFESEMQQRRTRFRESRRSA